MPNATRGAAICNRMLRVMRAGNFPCTVASYCMTLKSVVLSERGSIMNFKRSVLGTALLLSTVAMSGAALADRGSGHYGGHYGGWHRGYGGVGAFLGGTIVAGALLAPWYYTGPYYYGSYPAVVEVQPAPTVYVEQPRAVQPAVSDAGSWWYYCNESRAYYPYVRECASPWQRVAPTPPSR